eukprot:scpid23505/ scgid2785/ 
MAGYAYSHVMQNIIKNTELYNRCRTQPISKEIAARRWSFLGHVLRMPSGAPPQVALDFAASGALRGRKADQEQQCCQRVPDNQGNRFTPICNTASNLPISFVYKIILQAIEYDFLVHILTTEVQSLYWKVLVGLFASQFPYNGTDEHA